MKKFNVLLILLVLIFGITKAEKTFADVDNFQLSEIIAANIKESPGKLKQEVAQNKYKGHLLKIFNLNPIQATILKQTALSCGTDCAVKREVLTNTTEKTDAILFATTEQINKIIKKLNAQPFKAKILSKNLQEFINKNSSEIIINNQKFNRNKTYIMGILNYTPNSFSDGGEFFNKNDAISHFENMVNNGADIIDIGAESTAPNSQKTNIEEEINRIKTILPECKKLKPDTIISIDTRNSYTAKIATKLGADIINDVSGLFYDEKMVQVISNSNCHCVLTFNDIIQTNTLDETIKGLIKRINIALQNGISEEKIILDAGLGFNKTFEQNIELIKNANEICSIGYPVLYGISRKSFIQKITNLSPKETLQANISVASYLAGKGVNILRVHDVLEHKIALSALDKVLYD